MNNLINIVSNDTILNNIIDIKTIEKEAITNFLEINYPEITNISSLTKEIQDLKTSLIEEKEYDSIINNMIEDGE